VPKLKDKIATVTPVTNDEDLAATLTTPKKVTDKGKSKVTRERPARPEGQKDQKDQMVMKIDKSKK
jgi:hypothetical protein